MNTFFSTRFSNSTFNIAMLLLRVGSCVLMIPHGYDKLVHFSAYKTNFINFLGTGYTISLALILFAEFFCSIFVAIGLFTRLFSIPLIIGMTVALIKGTDWDLFGKGEHPALYILIFLTILLLGPGKISADGIMGK